MEGFGQKSFDNLIASAQRASIHYTGKTAVRTRSSRHRSCDIEPYCRACRNKWNEIESL